MPATRTRRSRWTVTMTRPGHQARRAVILSHSAAGARAHYERLGWVVLQVTPGDYRIAQQAREGGWHLDEAALKRACEELGLKIPVRIKQTGHKGGQAGCHAFRPQGGGCVIKGGRVYGLDLATHMVHHITVKSWLSAETAGRTIWHELRHAAQAEAAAAGTSSPKEALDAWRKRLQRDAGIAYRHKSIEVEARATEARNETLPLARRA